MASLYAVKFKDWEGSASKLLEASGLETLLPHERPVLIKPNLVTADPPPITTPVGLVAAIADFVLKCRPEARVLVGEGCGATEYSTSEPFERLGYLKMAKERKGRVELVDLNEEPSVRHSLPGCARWPEMHLPKLAMESFLISVPVLKAHSMSGVTLSMKNMLGIVPPRIYNAGSWRKSAFHVRLQEAIFDLNRYRKPDFCVMDASVGMAEAHLWGATCRPPVGLLAACEDPVRMADGVLGHAESGDLVELS